MVELFAFFVLAVALAIAYRVGSSRETHTPSRQHQPDLRSTHPDKSPVTDSGEKSRFDIKSAHEIEEKRIIKGAVYITDGDTIKIGKTQIRLFGVDAPELNHPYGKKAKWALHSLCKGQIVQARITSIDEYGRTVAHCTLPDGRDLSAEMVKLGLAIDWPKFSGGKYKAIETPDARKKLWLADARQKGRLHIWAKFEANQKRNK